MHSNDADGMANNGIGKIFVSVSMWYDSDRLSKVGGFPCVIWFPSPRIPQHQYVHLQNGFISSMGFLCNQSKINSDQ